MNMRRFAGGFEDKDPINYSSQSRSAWKGTTRSLMEPAHRWSRYFSNRLDDSLNGRPFDSESFNDNLRIYTGDSSRQLFQNSDELIRKIAFHAPSISPYLTELNFHTMNLEMTRYWSRLLDPEIASAPDYIDISVMQTRLAVKALKLASARRTFYDQTILQTPNPVDEELWVDATFAGRITEIEAGIAQLEMIKQQPIDEAENLVLLPAPGKYDRSVNRSTASDFLLFDTQASQAHGTQVKTNLRGRNHYDYRYVSLIDGVEDLGNFVESRQTNGQIVKKATPGLLSTDFILHSEGLQRVSSFSRTDGLQDVYGQIRHAQAIAEEIAPQLTSTDMAARAAEKIGPRILYALYESDLEKETEPEIDSDSEE